MPYINYIFVTDINIIIRFLDTFNDSENKQIIYIYYCIPSIDENEKKRHIYVFAYFAYLLLINKIERM